MKRWLLVTLFVSCLGVSIFSIKEESVFAQTNTEGEISLFENNNVTEPREPLDPSKPRLDDFYNPPTNEKGPLSLDIVPKGFYFGTQKMYHTAHTYHATGTDNYLQYVQVTDNRDANTSGWALKVRQANYLRDNQTGYELTGATLYLPKGEPKNQNNPNGPAKNADSLLTFGIPITNQETTVFSAPAFEKNGKATSVSAWQAQEVTLTIPKDTVQPGVYATKIYWILTDGGPAN